MNNPTTITPPPKHALLPVITITLLTFTATLFAGYITEQAVTNRLNDFFNGQADQIANTYYNKLRTHVTLLEGIRGLYNSTDNFTQDKFNKYLDSLDLSSLDKSGVSTYFYIPAISPLQVKKFTTNLRQEKINENIYKQFTIHPESTQVFHYPVAYGYPLEGKEAALGLDFATLPERRDAIEYARDHNAFATTKAVPLQTTGKPGFFFLLPLYRPGLPIERTSERKLAFSGVIGAAFRSESAFEQIFGREDPYPFLIFHIYEGDATTQDRLLYDSDPDYDHLKPRFTATRKVSLQEQSWTIVVESKPSFSLMDKEQGLPVVVFVFGLLATILLSVFSTYKFSKIRQTR